MNKLQAGYSRVNITPMLGIYIPGYPIKRYASGVLDELEAVALALAVEDKKVLLITVDDCHPDSETYDRFRARISAATGLPKEAVFLHATHTHTGANMRVTPVEESEKAEEYIAFVENRLADAADMALADCKPAKMGWAVSKAPNIAFVRRFRMKDGKVRTNPGVGNPDILHPIGDVDERVNVLRFDREGAETIVLANFGDHPDTIGGDKISGDWPGFFRRNLEQWIGVKPIFFNGAQGDVNHVNVNAKDGDLNGMFVDFDDVARGYSHARHMGNVVAGAVMQVFEKVNYVDVETLKFAEKVAVLPSNMPKPEDMAQARLYSELHKAGRDDEIPYRGMELTTVVAEANRMLRLEHGPEAFPMNFTGIAIGNVVLCGIPGEPFNGIGLGIKEAEGWDMVMPCCLTNGAIGYFPMQDAYDEGGYEARSSNFAPGVAEKIINECKTMLAELRG